MKRLKAIRENLAGIQSQYDTQGYISTNDADDLISYCRELIEMVDASSPKMKKPKYMDLDDD